MMKMVTHTEARSLEILKLKNLFEKSSNPPQVNQFVIHQNLEHDALTVSKLARSWMISTQISYSFVTKQIGVLQICSNKFWIRATCINDKNNNVYKMKGKETIHMLFFTTPNINNEKRHKSRRIVLWR